MVSNTMQLEYAYDDSKKTPYALCGAKPLAANGLNELGKWATREKNLSLN